MVTAYYSGRPPFAVVEGQTGLVLGKAKSVLAQAGVVCRFIELPSDRITDQLLQASSPALAVGVYHRIGEVTPVRFSLPLFREKPVVAVVRLRVAGTVSENPSLEGLLGSPLSLGLRARVSLGPEMDRRIRAAGVIPMEFETDAAGLLDNLRQGRADYTLLSADEAETLLTKGSTRASGLTQIELTNVPRGNRQYIAFGVGLSPEVERRINAVLSSIP